VVDAGNVPADPLRAAPQPGRLFAAQREPANFAPVAEKIAVEGGDMLLLCTDGVRERWRSRTWNRR
jgi:serine/threonine protein phosphatase PrpC